jgi:hypothetical protein
MVNDRGEGIILQSVLVPKNVCDYEDSTAIMVDLFVTTQSSLVGDRWMVAKIARRIGMWRHLYSGMETDARLDPVASLTARHHHDESHHYHRRELGAVPGVEFLLQISKMHCKHHH